LEQLQQCLTTAAETDTSAFPLGRGAHLSLGNPPTSFGVALSTRGLNSIIAHEPADMTVTVEAGFALTQLQSALAEHGQQLPLDPPGAGDPTIGGMLGANISGPLRHAYGTARDWLIGIRVAHADGTVSKSGGRVVKNVSGYDLHKAYVGSLGTLGVIAEATFKLTPLPKVDRTVIVACDGAAEAASVIAASHEAGLAVVAAELLSPIAAAAIGAEPAWAALLRIAGGAAAVDRTLRDVDEYAGLAHGQIDDMDDDVWPRWRAAFAPADLALRVSAMPSASATVAQTIDRRLTGDATRISATATAGLLRVMAAPRDADRAVAVIEHVREIAAAHRGFAIVDAASGDVKRRTGDVFGGSRADIAIMRRLKEQFDPRGILSPGRFVGYI
jgi:glycolate oxidase FAD binding subunit